MPGGATIEIPPVATPDLRAVAGDLIRELIRNDPALWARVQADPELRRQFGFEAPEPNGTRH